MDSSVKKILDMSQRLRNGGLEEKNKEEIRKRIADIVITSFGARDSQPVNILKNTFSGVKGKENASIFFTNEKISVDYATMINGTMTRYLDYNDTYLSKEALHPSDNIPPMIAVAESREMKMKDVIISSAVAYETVCALSDAVSIRDRGWDHVTYISISSGAGLATLLDLDGDKFENALNLSINNNISMRQTRAGELSMWKGATAANACRNSVFGTLLAEGGFTGPSPIFEGEMGFFRQVSGNMSLDFSKSRIGKTMIKNYPVEYHAMSAAQTCSEMRNEIRGEIKSIEVETFKVAHTIIIKDPEKLRPKTKETADHSMPFIIAYSLIYGEPVPESYTERYLKDQKILSLIDKMNFKVTDRLNKLYPEKLPFRILIKTDKGNFEREMLIPKGHYLDQYSWEDLRKKAERSMSEESARELVEFSKNMDNRDVSEFIEVVNSVQA